MLSKVDIQNLVEALKPEIEKIVEEVIDRKLDEKLNDKLGIFESKFKAIDQRFEMIEKQAEENFQTIIRYLEGTYHIQSTKLKEFKSIMVRSGSTLTEATNIRV